MSRPIRATIHTAALAHNLEVVHRHAPGSKVLAAVKANGYGHGLLRVAKGLQATHGFGVLGLDEAFELRDAGYQQKILLLEGVFSEDEIAQAAQRNISLVIHNEEQLLMLEQASKITSLPALDIFLKINTGMNRLGVPGGRFWAFYDRLKANRNVAGITLMTHFATADDSRGVTEQLARFTSLTEEINRPKSLANSAAILRYPETHADWVRPGIMLYGSSPFADQSAAEIGLQAAMTLESRIIAVQQLSKGDSVGYGALFTADKPMTVGIVACGYADGYPRHALTGTPVLVNGQASRTLGRVSMDMLCVDLTSIPQAQVGSKVELWGKTISIDAVAAAAGTVGYELMCAVTARVPVAEA